MMTPRFFIERRGSQIRLIFPAAQQHRINVYRITKRRKYACVEPIHTPWGVIAIGNRTARELGQALRDNRLSGEIDFVANDDWRMTINAMEITT